MANPLDQVASWPVTAAVGVASATGAMESAGPADRPFRWASVTKLLVALAALDAVQRGLLDLDEPAGPPGSTVRHLLSHASGLAFDSDAVLSQPGRRRIYSNLGIEIVADLIAVRSGRPFERVLADEICLPLGMTGTRLEGSPAWGAVGTLGDLMDLAVELASPSLVDEDLLAEATSTAFPGLSGVLPGFGRQPDCDWGLGFEIKGSKAPHWTGAANSPGTFGHFGQSGSFVWVDPEAGVACAGLADRDFGDWARQAWPQLSDDLLAAHAGPRDRTYGLALVSLRATPYRRVNSPSVTSASLVPIYGQIPGVARRRTWNADARDRCREALVLRSEREATMIPCGDIHHLRLTVTDVQRSREFYTGLLGFQVVAESPPPEDPAAAETFKILFGGVVMMRGNLIMGLRPMAPAADRFDPDRVGLDHMSFGVPGREDLERAALLFDERGVTHGEITRLPSFGIDVLPFEDPDGIQLELTAPITP